MIKECFFKTKDKKTTKKPESKKKKKKIEHIGSRIGGNNNEAKRYEKKNIKNK